jgi:hypothetical protein
VNYIRNSVKATVDAYDGTVTLYEFGEPDPVLQTWNKAFGGDLVKPESEISDDLRAHLRYPEDLFKVQRELLARYHVEQPLEFFTREDFWEIPADPADAVNREASTAPVNAPVNAAPALDAAALTGPAQPPFYSLLDFPGEGGEQFRLSTSFTGLNRPNLSAFASVSSDPETYGQIQVLKLPRNNPPNGPGPGGQPVPVRAGGGRRAVPVPAEPRRRHLRQPADAPGRAGAAVRAAGVRPGAGRRELPDPAAGAGELRQRGRREHHAGPLAGRPVRGTAARDAGDPGGAGGG